jgi:hypothetical protein
VLESIDTGTVVGLRDRSSAPSPPMITFRSSQVRFRFVASFASARRKLLTNSPRRFRHKVLSPLQPHNPFTH